MQACPYDALYIDPETDTAAKCNFCAHRVEVGLEPPCVDRLPDAGDRGRRPATTREPRSRSSSAAMPVQVRKPEKGTRPKVFYVDGDARLAGAAAARPAAGVVHVGERAPAPRR